MPLTDTTALGRSSQDCKLRCALSAPRQFALSDVDGFGADQGAPPGDAEGAGPTIAAFDQISSFGTISGSIAAGGWSCALTVPQVPATFADFFGVEVFAQTWYGGVPGVVGAAGVASEARIFRGWMTEARVAREFQGTTSTFTIKSGSDFLSRTSFTRGIDWASGLPHGAPGSSNAIIDHLIRYHTNYGDRSAIGIYLPDHALTSFSVNEGSVLSMIKSVADNFVLEGEVYCRREDDLFIGAHPNLCPDTHPTINDPIIEFLPDLMLSIEVPEVPNYQCTEVAVTAQKSDQTEYTARYYGGSGVGTRAKYQIRTDDIGQANALAALMFAHQNRRFRAVKVTTALNVAIDLGDCVLLTVDLPQRGISWAQKKFYVTAISYMPDLSNRTFKAEYTLDEIL